MQTIIKHKGVEYILSDKVRLLEQIAKLKIKTFNAYLEPNAVKHTAGFLKKAKQEALEAHEEYLKAIESLPKYNPM